MHRARTNTLLTLWRRRRKLHDISRRPDLLLLGRVHRSSAEPVKGCPLAREAFDRGKIVCVHSGQRRGCGGCAFAGVGTVRRLGCSDPYSCRNLGTPESRVSHPDFEYEPRACGVLYSKIIIFQKSIEIIYIIYIAIIIIQLLTFKSL